MRSTLLASRSMRLDTSASRTLTCATSVSRAPTLCFTSRMSSRRTSTDPRIWRRCKDNVVSLSHFALPRQSSSGGLPPLDLLHLVGFRAGRRDHLDRGALRLADQGARERRGDRDAPLLGVGLRFADDLPHLLLLG